MPAIPTSDTTQSALLAMERTGDPRLREILVSLVRHLHEFVSEVRLTEAEFRSAAAMIIEAGQASNRGHNEVVLLAGSLGISSLVCQINNPAGSDGTTQNLLGPFWRQNSPVVENEGSLIRSDTPGDRLHFRGRLVDQSGAPVIGAEVDIWHASPRGYYENQDAQQAPMNLRGKARSDASGCFSVWTVRPSGYPIPTDSVTGKLLRAQNRKAMRPAHIHVMAFQPGFKTLISQVYFAGDENIATDPQFGVTERLTAECVPHGEGTGRWYSLNFTFVMMPGEAVWPAAPIE
jgi:catechol 1,2-dioxygenase